MYTSVSLGAYVETPVKDFGVTFRITSYSYYWEGEKGLTRYGEGRVFRTDESGDTRLTTEDWS